MEPFNLTRGFQQSQSSREKIIISLIIPTLNEEKSLPYIIKRIPSVVEEIILVDGHSVDRTVTLAKKLCPKIKILFQSGKGKGNALRQGFQEAKGDIIITLDADGSMGPEEIPGFLQPLQRGKDVVKGSRFLPGGGTLDMPWYRRLGNRVLVTLVNLLYGTKYTDLCYGYNAFWKKSLNRIKLESDGFEIEAEMIIKMTKAKLKVEEIPSFEYKRLYGKGKLKTFRDGWRILKTILKERIRG